MNKHLVQLLLAILAILLGISACGSGKPAASTLSPTSLPPTITSAPLPTLVPAASTPTSVPALAPSNTPVPDMETIFKNNGFERDKTLDSACNTPCSAYKNSSANLIADYYYTNKSFSLLYYAIDPTGAKEQAEAGVVAKLLADLYSGDLSNAVMQVARDFPKNLGSSHGTSGNNYWSVSIAATYNLDQTIRQATIYISITPG